MFFCEQLTRQSTEEISNSAEYKYIGRNGPPHIDRVSSASDIHIITLDNMQFAIVWLDSNSTDHESTFLRKLDNQAQAFTDVTPCVQYIKSHPDQTIFFIVSGSLAKAAVPQVYDLVQVKKILLFCGSVAAYCQWALAYVNKILIFEHGDDLLERLWNELDKYLRGQADVCLQQAREFKERALRYQQKCGWEREASQVDVSRPSRSIHERELLRFHGFFYSEIRSWYDE